MTQAPHHAPSLSHGQLVERILSLNPSATADFLDGFRDSHLQSYLEHLQAAQRPRGREAVWVRPGESPAIMMAEAAD